MPLKRKRGLFHRLLPPQVNLNYNVYINTLGHRPFRGIFKNSCHMADVMLYKGLFSYKLEWILEYN